MAFIAFPNIRTCAVQLDGNFDDLNCLTTPIPKENHLPCHIDFISQLMIFLGQLSDLSALM